MLEKKKKGLLLFTIIIVIGAIFCFLNIRLAPESIYANTESWEDYKASGLQLLEPTQTNSITNPYIISTAEELALISYNVNTGVEYENVYFRQVNNINLGGKNFVPIGSDRNRWFSGNYDGNGFYIDNLEIAQGFDVAGLFGRVRIASGDGDTAGTLSNIHITSGEIFAGSPNGSQVGSIVGYWSGNKIENCYSGVTINAGQGNIQCVGGIAGRSLSKIQECYFYGNLNLADTQYVGGIVGINGDTIADNAIIENCFNVGKLQGYEYVGGIAGSNNGTISTVYNCGQITAEEIAGGLVGANDNIIVDGYNIGELFFGNSFVGAIVGQNLANASTQYLFYNKDKSNGILDIKAIGRSARNISNALDDTNNSVQGLNYHQMLSRQIPFANASNWIYPKHQQEYGRLPYPLGFDESVEDFARLTHFGGNVTSATWGDSFENAYLVEIPQQLKLIALSVDDGIDYQNKVFRLRDNINLLNIEYQPIGSSTTPFCGSFLGNGYQIRNLVIDSYDDNMALFAYTQNAIIENFTIDNFQISAQNKVSAVSANDINSQFSNIKFVYTSIKGGDYTAMVVGYAENCSISQCTVDASSSVEGNNYVGSLGGYLDTVSIGDCFSLAEIAQSNDNIGGLCGYAIGDIDKSYFAGKLQGRNYVGGLVGQGSIDISQSFVFLDEIIGADYVGGLVGQNIDSTMSLVYARANVIGSNLVAGLVGKLEDSSVSQSYYIGDIIFSGGGATIANTNNTSIQNVYYNTDLIESDLIIDNGLGLNTVQLTEDIEGLTTGGDLIHAPKQGLFGYYPRIGVLEATGKVLESIRCNYFLIGDGSSEQKPYQIATKLHLINMRELIDRDYDTYKNKFYSIVSDIYLTRDFSPIASASQPFLGRIKGNYYGIYNLNINEPNGDYVGLFRYVGENARIEEICIRPLVISADEIYGKIIGNNYVGAIAGYSEGNIWNCMNNTDIEGNNYVGGIAGCAENIARSFNTAVILGNDFVGGVVGSSLHSVLDSFNSGYILANGYCSGGITGRNAGTIEYCYNSGSIESSINQGQYAGNCKGGIVGQNQVGGIIRNSYNIGNIIGDAQDFIGGGIIADNLASEVSRVFYNKEINIGLSAIGQGNQGGANIEGLLQSKWSAQRHLKRWTLHPASLSHKKKGVLMQTLHPN